MSKIDQKIIYNLICNKELLQYLNKNEKTEFSSTCKYIYNNCTRFRLSSLNFNILDLANLGHSLHIENRSQTEIFQSQLEYLEKLVKKYKNYLLKLSNTQNSNYYILEYFSIQFNFLTSLRLRSLVIPREAFKKLIENLNNLRELYIIDLVLTYPLNDPLTQIQFPKYLNKLTWANVVNYKTYIKDPYNLSMLKYFNRPNHFNIMDSSTNSITSLKFLYWQCTHPRGIPVLTEILSNNPNLTSLYLNSNCLNPRILSLISTNKDLSILTISHTCRANTLSDMRFIKLLYIKDLNIYNNQPNFNETSNKIIESCQNLEILRYTPLPNLENHLFNLVTNLKKLKKLYIYPLYITTYIKILKTTFPSSDIEHIIIFTSHPLTINMNIFANFKCLKSVKIPFTSLYTQSFENLQFHYTQFKDWRVLFYPNTIYCWKI